LRSGGLAARAARWSRRTPADSAARSPSGAHRPRNCHDVTAYPAMHLLAAACSSHSIMVDISNPEKPVRRSALTDTNNFQGRHTAGSATTARRSS
jgi:hypothetical protein